MTFSRLEGRRTTWPAVSVCSFYCSPASVRPRRSHRHGPPQTRSRPSRNCRRHVELQGDVRVRSGVADRVETAGRRVDHARQCLHVGSDVAAATLCQPNRRCRGSLGRADGRRSHVLLGAGGVHAGQEHLGAPETVATLNTPVAYLRSTVDGNGQAAVAWNDGYSVQLAQRNGAWNVAETLVSRAGSSLCRHGSVRGVWSQHRVRRARQPARHMARERRPRQHPTIEAELIPASGHAFPYLLAHYAAVEPSVCARLDVDTPPGASGAGFGVHPPRGTSVPTTGATISANRSPLSPSMPRRGAAFPALRAAIASTGPNPRHGDCSILGTPRPMVCLSQE